MARAPSPVPPPPRRRYGFGAVVVGVDVLNPHSTVGRGDGKAYNPRRQRLHHSPLNLREYSITHGDLWAFGQSTKICVVSLKEVIV